MLSWFATEVFEFEPMEEAPSTMRVDVFDFEGPFTEAESVGHAEINFLKQKPEDLADLWIPLQGNNGRTLGSKVHLRIILATTKESHNAVQYIEKVEKEVGWKVGEMQSKDNILNLLQCYALLLIIPFCSQCRLPDGPS